MSRLLSDARPHPQADRIPKCGPGAGQGATARCALCRDVTGIAEPAAPQSEAALPLDNAATLAQVFTCEAAIQPTAAPQPTLAKSNHQFSGRDQLQCAR